MNIYIYIYNTDMYIYIYTYTLGFEMFREAFFVLSRVWIFRDSGYTSLRGPRV